MATIQHFTELESWKLARVLCKLVFSYTKNKGFEKDFRMISQILSSSGSIMDNIAEGYSRGGRNEFINFLSIANASNGETQSQLYRAFDFEYISKNELDTAVAISRHIAGKITNLISYLNKTDIKGIKFKDRTSPT